MSRAGLALTALGVVALAAALIALLFDGPAGGRAIGSLGRGAPSSADHELRASAPADLARESLSAGHASAWADDPSLPRTVLTGRVVDQSGIPASDAVLELFVDGHPWRGDDHAPELLPGSSEQGWRTLASPAGAFELDVPTPDAPGVTLRVLLRDTSVETELHFAARGEADGPLAAGVVALGEIEVVRTARVTGRVADLAGHPFADARVELFPSHEPPRGEFLFSPESSHWGGNQYYVGSTPMVRAPEGTRTNADGEFEFTTTVEGNHDLIVHVDSAVVVERAALDLRLGHAIELGELVGPRPSVLAGRIVDPEGRPIEGLEVRGRSRLASLRPHPVKTDATGAFELILRWDEPHFVVVWDEALLDDLVLGRPDGFEPNTHGVELVVDLPPRAASPSENSGSSEPAPIAPPSDPMDVRVPGRIVGSVVIAGEPRVATVHATSSDGEFEVVTTTDPSGAFALDDLPPGGWSVEARAHGCLAQSVRTLEVREGRELVLDPLTLREGAILEGRLELAPGLCAAGLTVVAFVDGRWMDDHRTRVRADGTFRFDALPSGSYSVLSEPSAPLLVSLVGTQVELLEGQTTSVVLDGRELAGATLEVVLEMDGRPLQETHVRFVDSSSDTLLSSGCTDLQGRVRLHGPPTSHGALEIAGPAIPSALLPPGPIELDVGDEREIRISVPAGVLLLDPPESVRRSRATFVVRATPEGGTPTGWTRFNVLHDGGDLRASASGFQPRTTIHESDPHWMLGRIPPGTYDCELVRYDRSEPLHATVTVREGEQAVLRFDG